MRGLSMTSLLTPWTKRKVRGMLTTSLAPSPNKPLRKMRDWLVDDLTSRAPKRPETTLTNCSRPHSSDIITPRGKSHQLQPYMQPGLVR